jgi:Uma2 family endonuclease
VTCPPFVYDEDVPHTVCNPRVVVEVLAPSTAEKDRGSKRLEYHMLESLTDYLMIHQNERRIEQYLDRKAARGIIASSKTTVKYSSLRLIARWF